MQILNILLMTVTCAVLGGVLSLPVAAQPPAQQDKLSFNPKLSLKWPGKPSVSDQILTTEVGEVKHYSATYADKQPAGVVLFFAFVTEFPEKALKDASPKEMLSAHVFAFKKDETSRKEI